MPKLYDACQQWLGCEFKYKQSRFKIIEADNDGFLCLQLTGKKKNYVSPISYKDFIRGVKTDIINVYHLGRE